MAKGWTEKRQTASGGTRYKAVYRDAGGRRHSASFDLKKDAERWLAQQVSAIARQTWIDPARGKVLFEDYARNWLEARPGTRNNTVINDRGRVEKHMLPAFGHMPLGSIQPEDVRLWVTRLARGLAPSTVARVYSNFRSIMKQAEIDQIVPRTPCIGIVLPREIPTTEEEMHFLSPLEVRQLAEAVGPRYRVLVYTAAYCGLRFGELAGLRIGRVDLDAGRIRVVEAVTESSGRLEWGPPKWGQIRTIDIPPPIAELLREQLWLYPSDQGLVFSAAKGGVLRRNFYKRDYKPAVLRAALPPGLRFHDLRHTCASLLCAKGASPKAIQMQLGHKDIRTTMNRYTHLFPEATRRLMADLGDMFDGALATDAQQIQTPSTHGQEDLAPSVPPGRGFDIENH